MKSKVIITMDTDWAPDFVVQSVLQALALKRLNATVFCTDSMNIDFFENIEYGIHPNFMGDSTQGHSEDEILQHLLNLYPEAKGIRTHRLYYHSGLNTKFLDHGLKYDSSIFLPFHPHIQSVKTGIIRFPYFWSDNIHICENMRFDILKIPNFDSPGLKIFDFHPIHIYLNTNDMNYYRRILSEIGSLRECSEKKLKKYINPGHGTGTFFDLLCNFSTENSHLSMKMEDLLA